MLSRAIIDSVNAARDRSTYCVTIDSPSPDILKAILGWIPQDEIDFVGKDYILLANDSRITVR